MSDFAVMASVLVSDVLRAFLLRKDDWRGLTNQQGLRKIEHHLQLPAGTLHRFRHFVYILHSAVSVVEAAALLRRKLCLATCLTVNVDLLTAVRSLLRS